MINQVTELSDGSINVDLWVDDAAHNITHQWSEDHVLYLIPQRSIFDFGDGTLEGWQSNQTFYVLPKGETEAKGKLGIPLPSDVKAIYVGGGKRRGPGFGSRDRSFPPPARRWSTASKKNEWFRNTGKPPHVRAHSGVRGLVSWMEDIPPLQLLP